MILALERILRPDAYPPDVGGARAAYRHIEAAVDRLTWPDVPPRFQWRALKAVTARSATDANGSNDVALALSQEFVRRGRIDRVRRRLAAERLEVVGADRQAADTERRDAAADGPSDDVDPAAQLVEALRQSQSGGDDGGDDDGGGGEQPDEQINDSLLVLNGVVSAEFLTAATEEACDTELVPPDAAPADQRLEVVTDVVRALTLDQVHPCIQPLNWPVCNEAFQHVTVEGGSFVQPPPDLAPFTAVVAPLGDVDLGTVDAFECRYREIVELSDAVRGGDLLVPTMVTTLLDCIEWKRSAGGSVAQIGMAYRHTPSDLQHSCVDIDEGYAIVDILEPLADGTPQVRIRSLKRISFHEPDALQILDDADMCDWFCDVWTLTFDLTTDVCTHRSVVTPQQVHDLSDHPQPADGVGAATPQGGEHWLPPWIADAEVYWRDATAIGFREYQRIEERRQSSAPVRSQDAFFDALEVWETNRRSLNQGLELTVKFWQHLVEGVR